MGRFSCFVLTWVLFPAILFSQRYDYKKCGKANIYIGIDVSGSMDSYQSAAVENAKSLLTNLNALMAVPENKNWEVQISAFAFASKIASSYKTFLNRTSHYTDLYRYFDQILKLKIPSDEAGNNLHVTLSESEKWLTSISKPDHNSILILYSDGIFASGSDVNNMRAATKMKMRGNWILFAPSGEADLAQISEIESRIHGKNVFEKLKQILTCFV